MSKKCALIKHLAIMLAVVSVHALSLFAVEDQFFLGHWNQRDANKAGVELSVTSQDGKLFGVITFLVVASDGATNGSDKQPMKNIHQEADTLRFEVIDQEGHQHSFQLVKAAGDQADLNETGAHEQEPIQMVRTKN